jgi:hypothetical protein
VVASFILSEFLGVNKKCLTMLFRKSNRRIIENKKPRNLYEFEAFLLKQRRRDSNPRTSLKVSGFQDRCNKPLYHSSVYPSKAPKAKAGMRFSLLGTAKVMDNSFPAKEIHFAPKRLFNFFYGLRDFFMQILFSTPSYCP